MKTLLAQFRRVRQKVQKMVKSGMGTDEIDTRVWFAYKAFAFLNDRNEPKATMDTMGQDNNEREVSEEEEGGDDDTSQIEHLDESHQPDNQHVEQDSAPVETQNIRDTFPPPAKRIKKVASKQKDSRLEEAYGVMSMLSAKRTASRDECALFGEQLACKLQKLDDRNRLILMHKINTLVFETEMRISRPSNISTFNYTQSADLMTQPYHYMQPSPSYSLHDGSSPISCTPVMSPNLSAPSPASTSSCGMEDIQRDDVYSIQ
ncbi:uncharacterized protein LOC116178701 [Photinus pyralis]|nr:uncharacterized protein LOC116178701 [Photinus pyralis]